MEYHVDGSIESLSSVLQPSSRFFIVITCCGTVFLRVSSLQRGTSFAIVGCRLSSLYIMSQLKRPSNLHVFASNAVDLTLEYSNRTLRKTGLLLLELLRLRILHTKPFHFFKGCQEILKVTFLEMCLKNGSTLLRSLTLY